MERHPLRCGVISQMEKQCLGAQNLYKHGNDSSTLYLCGESTFLKPQEKAEAKSIPEGFSDVPPGGEWVRGSSFLGAPRAKRDYAGE